MDTLACINLPYLNEVIARILAIANLVYEILSLVYSLLSQL